MSFLNEPVLVLNKAWMPVGTWTVGNTFSHVFGNRARIVDVASGSWESYDFMGWSELDLVPDGPCIRTAHLSLRLPEVAILLTESKFKREKIAFSKRSVLKRDHYTCAYCGRQGTTTLTLDHVKPRAKGGRSDWLNTVAACFECNSKKSDRTLEESGMVLRHRPHEPNWSPIFKVPHSKYKESWKQFLPEKHFA